MLRIPQKESFATQFAQELTDECMSTAEERQGIYEKAMQFYYTGSQDTRAAIHNKIKPFIDRLAGFLYQPGTVRFNVTFQSTEPLDVLPAHVTGPTSRKPKPKRARAGRARARLSTPGPTQA